MEVPSLPKEVRCILYNDIVGSTEKAGDARRQGQDDAHNHRVNQWYQFWRQALEAEEATFVKFLGDGLLAIFLDPLKALQAVVRVYLALQDDPASLWFPARFGLHIGPVSLRADGDILGADAAVGQRVMSCAHPGQILVSGAFAEQVRLCLPEGFALDYVGTRRLKGLENAPIPLYQVRAPGLPGNFPPLPLNQRNTLPTYLDDFVGRKRECRELRALLQGPARLTTLVGAPGCGKTRLAVRVAQDVLPGFADGITFVPLEETSDGEGVLSRIAAALSLPVPAGADLRALIAAACREARLLLILDNFEQALPAAQRVYELLQSLPDLRILVTSRARLDLPGEYVYTLDPLSTPGARAAWSAIQTAESVRLFAARAKAADQLFQLTKANAMDVAWLCRQLDGLPLALEIMAAETRYVPLAQLRTEFQALLHRQTGQAVPLRHRSLRAAFDHSYERLRAEDQTLFCQLGLFETPFRLAQVFDVCDGTDLERGLRRLQDQSLLHCDTLGVESVYRLLIPAREYARFRLGEPDAPLRQRFVAVFTRRAETLIETYWQSEAPDILLDIQADLDNYRVAWRLALKNDCPEEIAALGMALTSFAPVLPLTLDIASWVDATEQALKRSTAIERLAKLRGLSRLANTRARLANLRGIFVKAVEYQQEVLSLLSQCGRVEDVADAHSTLAFFALRALDYKMAERHAHLAIEKARSCRAIIAEAFACYVLAVISTPAHLEEAASRAERSLELFREGQDRGGVAHALTALAAIAEARGEPTTAERLYQDALRIRWEYRAEDSVARCLEALGRFYARQGDLKQADRLLLTAANAQKWMGMPETARLALSATAQHALESGPPSLPPTLEQVLAVPGAAQ